MERTRVVHCKDVLAELAEAGPGMRTKVIDGKTYFVDERLRQLRNVDNPHDYIDLESRSRNL